MRWFVGLVSAALRVVSSISVPPVWADAVELQNGQRVEGTFQGTDDSAVRIEVGGHIMTFAPAEVRAIYYGRSSIVQIEAGKIVEDRAVAHEPSLLCQPGHVMS
jgi:hypothetical protein